MLSVLNLSGTRHMPLLRQAEAAECALACVGMVASFHGHKLDLPALRRKFPLSLRGTTLKSLSEISSQLQLGSRALRCEPRELRTVRTPAILHWDMDHFVVLKIFGLVMNVRTIYSGVLLFRILIIYKSCYVDQTWSVAVFTTL